MEEKRIKELLEFIENNHNSKSHIEISEKDFQEILPKLTNSTLYAVDGGCSIILDGGSWIIAKIKTCYVAYQNTSKLKEESNEFLVALIKNSKVILAKKDNNITLLNAKDLEDGVNIMRSLFELDLLKKISETANEKDIILRDGSLSFPEENQEENKNLNEIKELCKKKNLFLVGINKTSRQSEGGRPILGIINEFSSKYLKNKAWLYSKEKIVKFHPFSDFCFKIDYENENFKDIMSYIAYYSSDPEILGYPYPLFKADKIARVMEFEKVSESNKIKMVSKHLGKEFIEFDEKSAIFHDLLDKRAYRNG